MTHDEKQNCEVRILKVVEERLADLYREALDDSEASGVWASLYEVRTLRKLVEAAS